MFENYIRDPSVIERATDQIGQWCEKVVTFYQNAMRVALIEAITAGIVTAFAFCVLNGTENAYETVLSMTVKIVLPTIMSYVLIWFLLSRLSKTGSFFLASWLPISVIGTLLALVFQAMPGLLADWNSSVMAGVGFVQYANKWATIIFTLLTLLLVVLLPLTAIVHYIGWAIRVLRS